MYLGAEGSGSTLDFLCECRQITSLPPLQMRIIFLGGLGCLDH